MAGPQTDSTGQIQKRTQEAPGSRLLNMLNSMRGEIARALPKHITPDRMARIATTALRTTDHMAQCTPESFLSCVIQCSQLGLEPNTPLGQAYLIPRKNNRRGGIYECTMIIGYQGMLELSNRTRGIVSVRVPQVVRDGDYFDFEYGLDERLKHVPSDAVDREAQPITHVYCVAKVHGEPTFIVLTKAQIEARKARSGTANSSHSPWKTDYEEMAKKTAIRALWKYLPKTPEIARAEAIEMVADTNGSVFEALDPEVAEALGSRGLLPEDAGEQANTESEGADGDGAAND